MKKIIFIFILLTPISLSAQDSDFGNWLIYIGSKDLNKGWNWHHEIQQRNYNAIGDQEQLLIRTGIGKNLTDGNNNLLMGYGYILSENYTGQGNEKNSFNEHRIFQQYITNQTWGRGIAVQHRYRFEQRFIEDTDFRVRFRYFLSIRVPITKPTIQDNTFYLSVYNEIFLDTQENPFDRNRVYAASGFQFSKNLKIELGYMSQLFGTGSRDQLNIMALVNF